MNEYRDHLDSVLKQVFTRTKKLNPKPSVCPDDELLAAYHAGNLTQKERERIEEHLVVCNQCIESLISFDEVESSYDTTKETFTTKEMVKKAKGLVKTPEKPPLIPAMALATIVMAVVVFGIYYLYMPSPEMSPFARLNIIARMPSGILIRGETPDYKDVEIQDGGVLHSGDMFRIRFELDEEAYVCVLSLDTLGDITKMFPPKDAEFHIKLKPHETYVIPKEKEWFRLDDNTGQETLYLLVSPMVIENIDQKIDLLRKAGIDKINEIFSDVKVQFFTFRHE
jgi:hypothetical protein